MKNTLFILTAAMILVAVRPAQSITIGQGPSIGTDKRGTTWYQEFQDWSSNNVRAVSANANQYILSNSTDVARDIIAFYSHDGGSDSNYYFRVDLFDLTFGAENGNLDVYVLIDCAAGGTNELPDSVQGTTDRPWEVAVKLYDSVNKAVATPTSDITGSAWVGSYWRSDLDGVEFGIKRQALLNAGWNGTAPLSFQVFTTKDFNTTLIDTINSFNRTTKVLSGSTTSTNTVRTAKYAAIAHANQSIAARTGTQDHILRNNGTLVPGFVRTIDTHEMLGVPLNMHLSGSLISSLLWARQNPSENTGVTAFPGRDGPTFLNRLKNFVQSGNGAIIGGVYSEHIVPYFEGEVNRSSIRAFNDLAQSTFGLATNDMKLMHTPERVMHSNTNWVHKGSVLQGKPFEDILAGGYTATYLDEVTHLHWWFYPGETNNPGWDENNWGRWAGGEGNDEEPYHHKIHKINGVLTFMINDREDQAKFGNDDGGMRNDTRYTLLDKALSPDPAKITIVFDDWEAYAGNSFGQGANGNADQWHNTIRWAANHQWIDIVKLKDVLTLAQSDTNWVIDHGYVYNKSLQTYEWLKKASEHDYDRWYYGHTGNGVVEENFAQRHPASDPSGGIFNAKPYGDMNTTNTLIRDSWDKVAGMPAGSLRLLAEWTYSAMIFETAWHDENAPTGWSGGNWFDAYKSRNYQITFDRPATGSYEDSNSNDPTSGWALRLHGHARKVGILADAAAWVQAISNGTQTAATIAELKNVDDDAWPSYILRNNRVYLCFKRWGGRLLYAFVYDPVAQDAIQVIGVPAANPSEETDAEGQDNNRCSGFKDRWVTGGGTNMYVDLDYALTAPTQSSNFWEFVSQDGKIRKRLTLDNGRDAVRAQYTLGTGVGALYIRHGLGPNQFELLHHGDSNLVVHTDNNFFYGLTNGLGGATYAVRGANNSLNLTNLPNAGYQNRELPLVEQVEVYNTATNFATWLAFSPSSAQDIDGDELSNAAEVTAGTDPETPDTDSDGMTDGYEVANALNALVDDANQDKDGDGMTNLQEFLAGTAANNAASLFQITSVTPQAVGYSVVWQSVTGKLYQVWSTGEVTNAFTLLSGTITGQVNTTSYPDLTAPGQRFYKVKLIAP